MCVHHMSIWNKVPFRCVVVCHWSCGQALYSQVSLLYQIIGVLAVCKNFCETVVGFSSRQSRNLKKGR